jgi:hypothetical protein
MMERAAFGKRHVSGTVGLTLDAWTALDYMAEEDGVSTSKVLNRLIDAEAARRLAAKAPAPEPPKARKPQNISAEERQRRSDRMRAWRAQQIAEGK